MTDSRRGPLRINKEGLEYVRRDPTFAVPDKDDVPCGWTPETLDAEWRWTLSDAQIEQLLEASAGVDIEDPELVAALHQRSVALRTLDEALDGLRHNLLRGRGFEVVRGLPAGEIGEAHATAAMLVLSSRLGALRPQNAAGDLVGHVRNTGAVASDPNVRLYQTDERQTFHTDSTDVVGLLALSTAIEGGDSLVVSAETVYHAVAETAPQLLEELFGEIATDRRGETPAGEDPWFTIPVFTWYDDALTVMYQRQYIESASRFDRAPQLTKAQTLALDALDDACNDPNLHAKMTLEVGDMQFVHNHSILHDRTGFVDDPDAPRHLIRTWMTAPGDRALHPVFVERFGSVTPGDRGGI